MDKTYCYFKTPRELIKAERILLGEGLDVVIRPVSKPVFGMCSMAIEMNLSDLDILGMTLKNAGVDFSIG